jgi:DNA (cytosine-5)-methyltransferase 1
MRLLDLFCGAGGAAMGYYRAGFDDITGIDIKPMPRYPFRFIQGDALEYLAAHGQEYDVIHASPPCQSYTQAQRLQNRIHPELIEPTRALLVNLGKPYIIENVVGAPLRIDLLLCGSMFNMIWENCRLYRHRIFEISTGFMLAPATCQHDKYAISIFGHTVLGGPRNGNGYKHPNERQELGVAIGREVMQIDWMTKAELSEAIPPAYTEFIGKQLIERVRR